MVEVIDSNHKTIKDSDLVRIVTNMPDLSSGESIERYFRHWIELLDRLLDKKNITK